MEDPALNKSIDELRELHTRWSQFHDFVQLAVKTPDRVSPEAEMKFLELKTRIAMLHDGFMQRLKHDQKIGQSVLSLLASCILLRRIPLMSSSEVQKLELDWNESYLLMSETIANLEDERQRLASVNERTYKINKMKEAVQSKFHQTVENPMFRLLFGLFVVLFVIVGVPFLGIYDYYNIKRDLPFTAPVYDKAIKFIRTNINKDLAYESFIAVEWTVVTSELHDQNPSGLQNITKDFLVGQFYNIGFRPEDFEEAKGLVMNSLSFEKEKREMRRTRKALLAMYVVFNTAADAKRFVELRRLGLDSKDAGAKARIDGTTNICRKANFLAIAVSEEEELRKNYMQQKWGFTDDQMNL